MGTAVLFPQDCLRPQSRLKKHSSHHAFPFESAPISKISRPTSSHGPETGLLPLPSHAPRSSPINIAHRGSDVKHIKTKKSSGLRSSHSPSAATSDLSVRRILQRPKQGHSSTELLAQFAIWDKPCHLEKANRFQVESLEGLEGCAEITVAQNGASAVEVDALQLKLNGLHNRACELSDARVATRPGPAGCKSKDSRRCLDAIELSAEGTKRASVKVIDSKLKIDVKENLSTGFYSPMHIAAKAVDRNDIVVTGQPGEEVQDKVLPKGFVQLRRTTTEPSLGNQVVSQYSRMGTHISFSNPRSYDHARRHQACERGVNFSLKEERWAGPAYSSSPPPSSLPLPRLCLPHAKFTTLELPPLVKQYSASVYSQCCLEPSAVGSETGEAWDAIFATKSLRRLLNLDP